MTLVVGPASRVVRWRFAGFCSMILLLALGPALAGEGEADATRPVGEVANLEGPPAPDRSHPPAVEAPELLTLPDPEIHALAPGVEAWFVRVEGVRHVEVSVIVQNGRLQRKESAAAWYATSATADVATSALDSSAVAELEDLHGMDVYTSLGALQGTIGFDAARDDLVDAWRLLDQVIHTSEPPKADLKRFVADQKQWYTIDGPASQGAVASAALTYAWFPSDHPYGERPALGDYSALTTRAIKNLYTDWLHNGPVRVLVVGDLPWAEAEPYVLAAVKGIGLATPRAVAVPFVPPSQTRVIGVDMPGQKQAALQLRFAAPRTGAPDRVPFWVTNWVLGGHFLSRLNTNLREEKGYTYGAGSSYHLDRTLGYTTVGADVQSEHVADAIVEIEEELARLAAEGVPAGELAMAHRSLSADWNSQLQTAGSAAGLYAALSYADEPISERRGRYQDLANLTTAETRAAAQAWMGAGQPRVWVVVGDRGDVAPQLDTLGWTVEWITPKQAILGGF